MCVSIQICAYISCQYAAAQGFYTPGASGGGHSARGGGAPPGPPPPQSTAQALLAGGRGRGEAIAELQQSFQALRGSTASTLQALQQLGAEMQAQAQAIRRTP